jgi:hypothetical protein
VRADGYYWSADAQERPVGVLDHRACGISERAGASSGRL